MFFHQQLAKRNLKKLPSFLPAPTIAEMTQIDKNLSTMRATLCHLSTIPVYEDARIYLGNTDHLMALADVIVEFNDLPGSSFAQKHLVHFGWKLVEKVREVLKSGAHPAVVKRELQKANAHCKLELNSLEKKIGRRIKGFKGKVPCGGIAETYLGAKMTKQADQQVRFAGLNSLKGDQLRASEKSQVWNAIGESFFETASEIANDNGLSGVHAVSIMRQEIDNRHCFYVYSASPSQISAITNSTPFGQTEVYGKMIDSILYGICFAIECGGLGEGSVGGEENEGYSGEEQVPSGGEQESSGGEQESSGGEQESFGGEQGSSGEEQGSSGEEQGASGEEQMSSEEDQH